jgi:hypothetical protein
MNQWCGRPGYKVVVDVSISISEDRFQRRPLAGIFTIPLYQTGTNDFQSGFQEGYQDAFGRRSPQIDMQNRDAVEIFSATGFRGHAMTMRVGSYDSINLDDVESLRIYGDVRVILFNRPDFEGRSVTLTADAPNLRDMQTSNTFWTFGLLKHHTGSMIIEPLR